MSNLRYKYGIIRYVSQVLEAFFMDISTLSASERHDLMQDLLPDLIVELETTLETLIERSDGMSGEQADRLRGSIETLWHLEQYLPDPDQGAVIRPEILDSLRNMRKARALSLEEVQRELGLDE